MSSFTAMGREYKTDDFLKEALEMGKLLATNARLIDPLPKDIDLSEAEQNEVQSQVIMAHLLYFDNNRISSH